MSAVSSVLRASGEVASWAQLVAQTSRHAVKHAARNGHIVRVLPRVYAAPHVQHSVHIRMRAGLLFAGPGSCLSHTTALAQWPRLHIPVDGLVHVLAPADRQPRSSGFVRIHRYRDHTIPQRLIIFRHGLATTRPQVALLDAWSILPSSRRRAPVIDAVRLGLVHPDQLALALRARTTLTGRAELRRLIDLLRAGCRSELELMGFIGIFSDPQLPLADRQVEVIVCGRRYVLDVAWPELLLAVELDGAAYHGSTDARENDVRRDSALAGIGWFTIRITYERLVGEPAVVIEELLGIIAVRRRQLGLAA